MPDHAQAEEFATASEEQNPKTIGLVSTTANGNSHAHIHNHVHRPHMIIRSSSEKELASPQTSPKGPKETKSIVTASPGRRNSWMSSISSKFSSTSSPSPNGSLPTVAPAARNASSPVAEQPNPFGASFTPGTKEPKKQEPTATQTSQSPKSGHPSFLQSAFRRLSSSSPGNLAKTTGNGGVCERKTMNIDPHRERCVISDLEPAKLRRVAFCVDVEIAAPARYAEDEEEESPPPVARRSSLTQLEHQVDIKKKRDQRFKKSEGEALKNSNAVAEEKDKDGVIITTGEKVQKTLSPEAPTASTTKDPTRKKEKKKRSEEERKERKEKKLKEALANGTVPAELQRECSSSSATESQECKDMPLKSQDRPTTDPLRIYRRCCQLRETPILKRITEQIALPSACLTAMPGVISVLDLSNYWMQLPDIVTLSDYLAVVPVKRLMLENCGLGDEAVRVILAGLLAAKTLDQAKHNKRLGRKADGSAQYRVEQLGVVEKVSLKNNPKIGREGWRHIALFINMSKSLKAIDLSMIPFTQTAKPAVESNVTAKSASNSRNWTDIPSILRKAIGERLAGSVLEELVMAECGLSTDSIGKIVDGVRQCGVTRLGLANNNITSEGLEHVIRFVQTGNCQGLDLGGNNLREHTKMLAESLDEKNALYALSLADCKLSASSLEFLLPALVRLPNFRFIDLSHNHDLFTAKPSAIGILRRYIPQFPLLKRLHLLNVAMSSEQAIALAEVLPESRSLAHLNILDNEPLSRLASAKDEASQEEACALYASLMVAVRVSSTIICIDIDVPDGDSSEVIKALAKQVIAYSLRNLERTPLAESTEAGVPVMDSPGVEKEVHVPDILLHLVGHMDGVAENHDNDEPAPDDDYIVGGTGVVKALGVCLNRAGDHPKPRNATGRDSGTVTPRQTLQGSEETKGKAKEMSKDLLGSARKIRARLLPALIKEAKSGDTMSYKRLQFLDLTLERMIQRFENEYPETRLEPSPQHPTCLPTPLVAFSPCPTPQLQPTVVSDQETLDPDPESETDQAIRIPPVRQGSDVSLASRQAQEEGRMHRFGQRMRRDILRPETLDYAHGTTGQETEASHLQDLRRRLEAIPGAEIRDKVRALGPEALLKAIGATVEELRMLERSDNLEGLTDAQVAALENMDENGPGKLDRDVGS